MVKRNLVKRIVACVLAGVLTMTSIVPGIGTMTAEAASNYTAQSENLLRNTGFEEDFGSDRLQNWVVWKSAAKTTDAAYDGTYAAAISGAESSLEQDIAASDLIVGATYVYSIWAKLSAEVAEESTNYQIGVKNYGSDQIIQYVRSTEWQKYEIEFVYTGSNDARFFGWVPSTENNAVMYMDDASVTLKSDVSSAKISNGTLEVTLSNVLSEEPAAEDFHAVYSIGEDQEETSELVLTKEAWDADTNTIKLSFEEIAQLPGIAQDVYVVLTYRSETINLDFTVEAGEGEAVTAAIASAAAENGKVTVVLDKEPTIAPKNSQFTWEYKLGEGEYQTLAVNEFSYDKDSMTVTVNTETLRSIEDVQVEIRVSYGESVKTATFTLEASESTVYYVDSTNGNDANDGISEETAFQTIDKLNTLTFYPGDQILFKNGETYTGCFKPQGSGTEQAPITIGTYGDASARPVLQPGDDWTVTHVMSAGAMDTNVKVNYVIQFYNVEYWEVDGLEIKDPNSEAYLTQGSGKWIGNASNDVYRSGITIQAEDIGTLKHIYVNDVIIHGFHGPLTNLGKTSGGITMNVITNQSRNREESVPTQINDIRITNCEIYDVGRSGINFLTPWSYRTDEKWGSNFNYGTSGYDYLPYEDFYMANNYIHDVDGDGTIIDNCKDAVAEYNLVTRCNLRSNLRAASAAVGLFNWNSDNTTFQYNEVYDIRTGVEGASYVAGDAQGIEIDALNDVTYVQYNYVHDNYGGFMMYCNTGDRYRSFDGIVRYNISQNDYAHPRQGLFDIYSANYGTEIYNNTFYLTERALNTSGQIFLFNSASAYETMKFYNNIFYYDGEEAAAANTFGDASIDWRSNIFYGFTNLPVNDDENAPNLNVDPKFENASNGKTGEDGVVINRYKNVEETPNHIDWVDVTAYKLQADSPAINAGVKLEDQTNTRDYFGNNVAGIPDIGAYESGSILLELRSLDTDIVVNQENKTITLKGSQNISASQLEKVLYGDDGVAINFRRDAQELTGGMILTYGDKVIGTSGDDTFSYVIRIAESEETDAVIPTEHMTVTAGTAETISEDGKAENVLDGNVNTIWHSAYNGSLATPTAADKYLTLEIKDGYEYEITGYVYTPRTGSASGAANGIITKYEIYTSDDNTNWSKKAEGDWDADSEIKSVTFDTPVKAKYVKLLAVESVNGFVSAAEVRLTGTMVDTQVPSTPVITAAEENGNVTVRWEASTDNVGVAYYVLYVNGEEFISVTSETTECVLDGLNAGREYKFELYAVDQAGNKSVVSEAITLTTSVNENEKTEYSVIFTEAENVDAQSYLIKPVDGFKTKIEEGSDFSFTLEINEGYEGDQLVVAIDDQVLTPADGIYTIKNITKDVTVTVGGIKKHEHTYGNEWKMDASQHWMECTCGDKSDAADHTFEWVVDTEASEYTTGTKHEECTVCHVKRSENTEIPATHEHDYGTEWKKNDSQHWMECSCDDKKDAADHTFTWVTDQECVGVENGLKHEECSICGFTRNENTVIEAEEKVLRLEGSDRYGTSQKIAELLKEKYGVDKFESAIVAIGRNKKEADALSGSYLAVTKNAPILLTNETKAQMENVTSYIVANVEEGATIYILGGYASLPEDLDTMLEEAGYTVKRLAGNTRYETSVKILEETGITGDELIVATGKTCADSLSASATGRPILLVKPGLALDDAQKAILEKVKNGTIYIAGGTSAVTEETEAELKAYGTVKRLAGSDRYETSVMIANEFFTETELAVIANGKTAADGLCGGPLAYMLKVPMILTKDGNTARAESYFEEHEISSGYVLGGTSALSEKTVNDILGLK